MTLEELLLIQVYPYLQDNSYYLNFPDTVNFVASELLQPYHLDHLWMIEICKGNEKLSHHVDFLEYVNGMLLELPFNNIAMRRYYLSHIFNIYFEIGEHLPQYKHFMYLSYQREIA